MTSAPAPRIFFESFKDRISLADSMAVRIAHILSQEILRSGRASLALSGGSTPGRFLSSLSGQDIQWQQVDVTLVDERWVPETNNNSNAGMIRSLLLQGRAKAASFTPLFTQVAEPEAAIDYVEERLRRLALPLSVVVLGMGEDGHTASFFSGADRLAEALDPLGRHLVVPVIAPGVPQPRMTLTLPLLLSARKLILHIEGDAKRRVLERAHQAGPTQDMPIRAILRHATQLDIVWAP